MDYQCANETPSLEMVVNGVSCVICVFVCVHMNVRVSNRLLLIAHSRDLIKMCESMTIITVRLDKYLPIEYFNECYSTWQMRAPATICFMSLFTTVVVAPSTEINLNDCHWKSWAVDAPWLPNEIAQLKKDILIIFISKLKSNGRNYIVTSESVCTCEREWILCWCLMLDSICIIRSFVKIQRTTVLHLSLFIDVFKQNKYNYIKCNNERKSLLKLYHRRNTQKMNKL